MPWLVLTIFFFVFVCKIILCSFFSVVFKCHECCFKWLSEKWKLAKRNSLDVMTQLLKTVLRRILNMNIGVVSIDFIVIKLIICCNFNPLYITKNLKWILTLNLYCKSIYKVGTKTIAVLNHQIQNPIYIYIYIFTKALCHEQDATQVLLILIRVVAVPKQKSVVCPTIYT